MHPEQAPFSSAHTGALAGWFRCTTCITLVSSAVLLLFYGERDYSRDRSVYKSPQYYVVWEHWPDSYLLLPFPWLHPSSHPYAFSRASTHTDSTLSEKINRAEGETLFTTWQVCFFYQEHKEQNRPPSSPQPKPRGAKRKLWKGQPINGAWVTAAELKPQETCLLPQLWVVAAIGFRSHTCCKSFSQNWPQADLIWA